MIKVETMLRFKSQTQEQVNMMHVDVVTLTAIVLCFPLLTLCDPL